MGRDACHEPGNEQSMLNEVDIEFRISGLPDSVVKQAQNSRVRELVKKIENHLRQHALQRDLQQIEAYNPFSMMTKQMIQDVGLSYWSEGMICCTCGHLLKENVANRSFIENTLDLLSIPEYLIKKGRPHGHRYGKTAEKNITWPIICKSDASREISKGSMIVSCQIMFFANVCSNMIEMKMFALNGTILQNKISPIKCQNQNIFTSDNIGGSLSKSLETLTSTKRCLH